MKDINEIYTRSDNSAFQIHKPLAEIGVFSLIEGPPARSLAGLRVPSTRAVVQ